jgi:hypothetical protein
MEGERASLARFDGFDALYQRELEPALHAMEEERRQAWRQVFRGFVTWGIGFSVIGAVIGGFVLQWPSEGYLVWFLIFCAVSIGTLYQTYVDKVRSRVKKILMETICGFLDLDYSEKPSGRVRTRTFVDIDLIRPYSYSESKIEDEITGTYNGVDFAMVEADLKKRIVRQGNERKADVFKGILATYTFRKRFQGTTRVHRRYTNLDFLGDSDDRVLLEDPEFEGMFDVYATDQIEARYILTPGFMEKIKDMERQILGTVKLAFHEDRLYIALESETDQFEAGSMFSKLTDPERASRIARQIHTLFMIPDALSLDGRP